MAKRNKIALIGAGNIGGELAAIAARKQLGDVVLFDIPSKADFAKGKALDLMQNSAITRDDASIIGSSDWADCAGADVMIITAGVPRKPGQSRDDLVGINLPIIKQRGGERQEALPRRLHHRHLQPPRRDGVGLPAVDGLPPRSAWSAWPACSTRRGSSTSSRPRRRERQGRARDGARRPRRRHGPGARLLHHQRRARRAGDLERAPRRHREARTRGGGGEIVKLMGTSAYYAPATAAMAMAEAYLLDQKRLLAAAAYLTASTGTRTCTSACPWSSAATASSASSRSR
jgi:malate dehydrogenase